MKAISETECEKLPQAKKSAVICMMNSYQEESYRYTNFRE